MKNLVLIVLDTVRKDYFDKHAENIRRLATTEFDRCYAPSTWSIPSHASIFSGALPHSHGVHTYNPDYSTLEQTFLNDIDHNTFGISANGAVSDSFGFDSLCDEFCSFSGNEEYSPRAMSFNEVTDRDQGYGRNVAYLSKAREKGVLFPSLINGIYIKLNNVLRPTSLPKIGDFGADAVVNKTLSTIDKKQSEPFFCFLNFIDAHEPMENLPSLDSDVSYGWNSDQLSKKKVRTQSPEDISDYLEKYRDLYAANISYLDRKVSYLVEELQEMTERETVFLITADHGEQLRFENERDLGHMDFSNGLLHVPFVVINAETDGDTETVNDTVSLLDVPEIVKSLAKGGNLPQLSRERIPAERIGMMFADSDAEHWTRAVRTVYEDDIRYEWDSLGNTVEITVTESTDETRVETEIPDKLKDKFDKSLSEYLFTAKQSTQTQDVSEETMKHLENLGYKV